MANTPTITEADILKEIVAPERGGFLPDEARLLLHLKFTGDATKKIPATAPGE